MVLRPRPDSQAREGMGTGRGRRAVRPGLVGFRADAGALAQGDRRPRDGGGETGVSRYAGWPCPAGPGSYPAAYDIAEFFSRLFLRHPEGYRFWHREKRRED